MNELPEQFVNAGVAETEHDRTRGWDGPKRQNRFHILNRQFPRYQAL
jgi:hypothetical protein